MQSRVFLPLSNNIKIQPSTQHGSLRLYCPRRLGRPVDQRCVCGAFERAVRGAFERALRGAKWCSGIKRTLCDVVKNPLLGITRGRRMEKSVLMVARAVSDLTGCSNDLFDFGDASAKHQFCSEERWDVGADESLDHNEYQGFQVSAL